MRFASGIIFRNDDVAEVTTRPYSGVEVPIPTFPFARILKRVVPDEEATKRGFVAPVPRIVSV